MSDILELLCQIYYNCYQVTVRRLQLLQRCDYRVYTRSIDLILIIERENVVNVSFQAPTHQNIQILKLI